MTIGIIGIGHVGMAFARYIKLYESDYDIEISGCYTRNGDTKEKISGLGIDTYPSIKELLEVSDLIMITTPDDVIGEIVTKLLNIEGSSVLISEKQFVHCSGAKSTEVFKPLVELGASAYSLHPIKAFAGLAKDVTDLGNCYVTKESHPDNSGDEPVLFDLFQDRMMEVDSKYKSLYHAAAVMVSNYSVTLVQEGIEYFTAAGFSEPEAYDVIGPLLLGTVGNLLDKGTFKGLTGPIVRGDHQVVNNHIESISKYLGQESVDFYRQLSLKTLNMIKDKRINEAQYNKMYQVIKKEGK